MEGDSPVVEVEAGLPGVEPPVTAGVEGPAEEPGLEPPCERGVEAPLDPPLVVEGELSENGALVAGMLDIDVGGAVYVVVASGTLVAATASLPATV